MDKNGNPEQSFTGSIEQLLNNIERAEENPSCPEYLKVMKDYKALVLQMKTVIKNLVSINEELKQRLNKYEGDRP